MKRLFQAAPCVVIIGIAASGCGPTEVSALESKVQRESIELTVYSGDFGVVREVRQVPLAAGENQVALSDFSRTMDPSSLLLTWLSGDAEVRSTSYHTGVEGSGDMLKRFLGKPVDLVYYGDSGKAGERQTGILEVAEQGNVVVRLGDRYVINPPATIEAPLAGAASALPELLAGITSTRAQMGKLTTSYQTRGLSWRADYVLTLPREGSALDLECWATVANRTGTDFPNAKLKFVAGRPNAAVRKTGGALMEIAPSYRDYDQHPARDRVNVVETGELFSYPVDASATLLRDQESRVKMISAAGVAVTRDYSIRLPSAYSYHSAAAERRIPATLAIHFLNREQDRLGLPLPGGAVRVYEPDEAGNPMYIGAAEISDTPKDTKVYLTLSNVFNIYAQHRLVKNERLDRHTVRQHIEVTVKNEKSVPAEVRLVHDFWGNWKMASSSVEGQKLNSASYQWTVTVPAGGEQKISYQVDFRQ
jgi:hypothetical protein